MGTKVAPSFANLFMGNFEENHVYNYFKKPLLWLRYIDDIFFVYEGSRIHQDEFLQHINSAHPNIKFTTEISHTSVPFLDTTVYIKDGRLCHTLFSKKTDKHNYLLFDSCHPKHTVKGIPFGQFLRIRKICTEISEFDKNATILAKHFKSCLLYTSDAADE